MREPGPRRHEVRNPERKAFLGRKEFPEFLIGEQRFSCWDDKEEIQGAKSQLVSWCNRWGQLAHGNVPSLFTSQHFLDSCCA